MAADAAVTVAARLDRLPPSRHTRRLITLLSLGAWFEFYDLFFTAYVAIGLFKEGLFKPTTQGLFDLHGSPVSSPRCSPGCSSARSPSAGSPTVSAAVRSSPSHCSGIRSVHSSWHCKNAGDHRSLAVDRQHRARRRIGERRRLFVGAGAEGAARPCLRLQPVHHVYRRADRRVPRLAAGAAGRSGVSTVGAGW